MKLPHSCSSISSRCKFPRNHTNHNFQKLYMLANTDQCSAHLSKFGLCPCSPCPELMAHCQQVHWILPDRWLGCVNFYSEIKTWILWRYCHMSSMKECSPCTRLGAAFVLPMILLSTQLRCSRWENEGSMLPLSNQPGPRWISINSPKTVHITMETVFWK